MDNDILHTIKNWVPTFLNCSQIKAFFKKK